MKCFQCKKKVLFLIDCRCSKKLCISCSHAEVHNCTFDYKTLEQTNIKKMNPILHAEKLEKI